jgi:hypothetical protein
MDQAPADGAERSHLGVGTNDGASDEGATPDPLSMADLRAVSHGSIALVTPLTAAGETWLQENTVTERWQWLGKSLGVDHRYIIPLLEGAIQDGLEVETA